MKTNIEFIKRKYISIRRIMREYTQVAEELKKENIPFIVNSDNEPQFAIVSIDLLDRLLTDKLHRTKFVKRIESLEARMDEREQCIICCNYK